MFGRNTFRGIAPWALSLCHWLHYYFPCVGIICIEIYYIVYGHTDFPSTFLILLFLYQSVIFLYNFKLFIYYCLILEHLTKSRNAEKSSNTAQNSTRKILLWSVKTDQPEYSHSHTLKS